MSSHVSSSKGWSVGNETQLPVKESRIPDLLRANQTLARDREQIVAVRYPRTSVLVSDLPRGLPSRTCVPVNDA